MHLKGSSGNGWRHNDISYKMMRRSFSDQYNLIVIGVNYMGTDVYVNDNQYVTEQITHMFQSNQTMQALSTLADPELTNQSKVCLDRRHWNFASNAQAAEELKKERADIFWDYGYLQAIDVLSTLHYLKNLLDEQKLTVNFSHVNLVGESAGSQVGAMCMKLAPLSFSSFLDISGAQMGLGQEDILHSLLTDPYGTFGDKNPRGIQQTLSNGCILSYPQKNPLGFKGEQGHSKALLKDELTIRDVGALDEAVKWEIDRVHVRSLHAINDHLIPATDKEKLINRYRTKGANAEIALITQENVDGSLFKDTSHDCVKDRKLVYSSFGEQLWTRPGSKDWKSDIGTDHTYHFPSENGAWTMRFLPEPSLSFSSSEDHEK